MKTTRRSIRKLPPSLSDGFESQFWPVFAALCTTASLAAGAILSTLKGTWMWGSLLALPALVGVAILTIQRIPNNAFRRSLQFAVLCSVAVHLLVLILAAWAEIFTSVPPTKQVANAPQRSQRVLLVQQRATPQIWQQVDQQPPVEEAVENDRQQPSTSNPTNSDQLQPAESVNQPVTRDLSKKSADSSVAKLSETLSERKRSQANEAPNSGGKIATNQKLQPKNSNERPSAAAASASAEKTNTSKSSQSAQSGDPQLNSETTSPSPREAVSVRRNESNSTTDDLAAPSLSTSRLRERSAQVTQSTRVTGTETTPRESTPNESVSKENASVPARSIEQRQSQLSEANPNPEPQLSPNQSVARMANRRENNSSDPTAVALERDNSQPRRARNESSQVTSPQPLESPSLATTTRSASDAQPQAAKTSVTRAEKAGALAQHSANLTPENLPESGIAPQAASAAKRRESAQNQNLTESLTSQQSTSERRSVASQQTSSSSLTTNTLIASSLRGQRNPSPKSTESSAAQQSSSLAQDNQKIAADEGDSALDTGSTKSVSQTNLAKKSDSGGGLPDLGQLQTDDVPNAQRESTGQAPALASKAVAEAQANRGTASSNPSASVADPTESAFNTQRSGGTVANSAAPRVSDELSGLPESSAENIAGSMQPSKRTGQESNSPDGPNFEIGDETHKGNQRSGISRAPTIQPSVSLAQDQNLSQNGGTGRSENIDPASAAGERAVSMNARRSTNADAVDGPMAESDTPIGNSLAKNSQDSAKMGLANLEVNEAAIGGRLSSAASLAPSASTKVSSDQLTTMGDGDRPSSPNSSLESTRIASSSRSDVSAAEGPSGLGDRPDVDAGVPTRPASRDSLNLQLTNDARFQRESSSSSPSTRVDAVSPSGAFRDRSMPAGGGPTTEASIELGLQFLSRFQHQDGSWSLGDFDQNSSIRQNQLNSDSAATGLSLLAFQGAGYTHREFKYAGQMQRGINWLIKNQSSDGCLYVESDDKSNQSCRMYSHAIATLVLTEAYGMTQDPMLREPCQKALEFIESTQDPANGGWRYFGDVDRRRTDTSVTGWMMMALQSGRLAGFETRQATWKGIESWLDIARDPVVEGRFRYDPFAVESQPTQRNVSTAMTSVGLLMRLYTGWNRDDGRLISGADYLLASPPGMDDPIERDTYYWYYATQVLRHVGGNRWAKWNAALHPLLVESQVKTGELAGSWHPYAPVPDRWGITAGRLYVTTMNLLSLEVDYRLLPLYEETSK